MIAPLMIAERLEARALAANAVRSAFYERFGEHPSADDRLSPVWISSAMSN